jgi:hypothetical protein
MNMNMNKQQIEIAIGTGLELLGDKSDLPIPARLTDGTFLLKQLLLAIGNGSLGLTPTQPTPPAPPEIVPVDPEVPTPAE